MLKQFFPFRRGLKNSHDDDFRGIRTIFKRFQSTQAAIITTPLSTQEFPAGYYLYICGYQGSSHFQQGKDYSRKPSVSFPTLSRPPNPTVRIALPLVNCAPYFISHRLLKGTRILFQNNDHTKKSRMKKNKDHAYPNLYQKLRGLRYMKQGKPLTYVI